MISRSNFNDKEKNEINLKGVNILFKIPLTRLLFSIVILCSILTFCGWVYGYFKIRNLQKTYDEAESKMKEMPQKLNEEFILQRNVIKQLVEGYELQLNSIKQKQDRLDSIYREFMFTINSYDTLLTDSLHQFISSIQNQRRILSIGSEYFDNKYDSVLLDYNKKSDSIDQFISALDSEKLYEYYQQANRINKVTKYNFFIYIAGGILFTFLVFLVIRLILLHSKKIK